jgi:hypothetical protein
MYDPRIVVKFDRNAGLHQTARVVDPLVSKDVVFGGEDERCGQTGQVLGSGRRGAWGDGGTGGGPQTGVPTAVVSSMECRIGRKAPGTRGIGTSGLARRGRGPAMQALRRSYLRSYSRRPRSAPCRPLVARFDRRASTARDSYPPSRPETGSPVPGASPLRPRRSRLRRTIARLWHVRSRHCPTRSPRRGSIAGRAGAEEVGL